MKKKVRISYFTKDIERSHYEKEFVPRVVSETVEGKSTKRYHNTMGITVQLGKCARLLLDYVVEIMDDDNLVNNNSLLKNNFNELIKSTGQPAYGNVAINKAFSELMNHHLLLTQRKKGTYQVNPLFYFNGSEKKRQKLIRKHLERPYLSEFNKIRREHFENLEKDDN